ncbi:hypothetical protein DUI87_06071 [Hirundo rustica rustica]|uniref:Uncharacterized protein n=1 Tax=Hirundo rustica rustica TaxID=333673 RepID=A0A3M0KUC4_HIRRU|nr:hypothetical protein DUI87_06071 [Hirundo rustica rustica]
MVPPVARGNRVDGKGRGIATPAGSQGMIPNDLKSCIPNNPKIDPKLTLDPVLEALVALVATLGELVATVAGPDEDVLRVVSPRSLRAALRKFTWHLHCTLNLRGVTSLGQRDVTSLGQAVAALGANPGASSARARLTAAASAWRELVAALMESWDRLAEDATKLHEDWGTRPPGVDGCRPIPGCCWSAWWPRVTKPPCSPGSCCAGSGTSS